MKEKSQHYAKLENVHLKNLHISWNRLNGTERDRGDEYEAVLQILFRVGDW